MRILYVNHTQQPSGATISLGTLLRFLPERAGARVLLRCGAEVAAALGLGAEQVVWERWMPMFPTTLYGRGYGPLLWGWHLAKLAPAGGRFRAVAKRIGAELIHLNETSLLAYAWYAAALGLPVVMHARTVIAPRGAARRALAACARIRRLRVLCVDSETLASLPGSLRAKAELLPNPIALAPCGDAGTRPRLRAAGGGDDASVFVGQVASLHEEKGVWQFLEVARAACARDARLRFVLVGDDRPGHGLGPELKARVAEAGLGGRVVFAGYHADLPSVYAALDAVTVLFGQGLAGIGRSAFEAGLCGLPVIATCPDVRSPMLFGGEAGRILAPADTDGVVREVLALAGSAEARKHLGARARELLSPRHDPAAYAARVRGIYDGLLRNDARR
ncbi:MAG: glycosyltransferase family 4 protein [Verrucomicrobiae bacterium]|nr:glycosyltransferase family 4 protein [Verrucomicrobiae bacterium]